MASFYGQESGVGVDEISRTRTNLSNLYGDDSDLSKTKSLGNGQDSEIEEDFNEYDQFDNIGIADINNLTLDQSGLLKTRSQLGKNLRNAFQNRNAGGSRMSGTQGYLLSSSGGAKSKTKQSRTQSYSQNYDNNSNYNQAMLERWNSSVYLNQMSPSWFWNSQYHDQRFSSRSPSPRKEDQDLTYRTSSFSSQISPDYGDSEGGLGLYGRTTSNISKTRSYLTIASPPTSNLTSYNSYTGDCVQLQNDEDINPYFNNSERTPRVWLEDVEIVAAAAPSQNTYTSGDTNTISSNLNINLSHNQNAHNLNPPTPSSYNYLQQPTGTNFGYGLGWGTKQLKRWVRWDSFNLEMLIDEQYYELLKMEDELAQLKQLGQNQNQWQWSYSQGSSASGGQQYTQYSQVQLSIGGDDHDKEKSVYLLQDTNYINVGELYNKEQNWEKLQQQLKQATMDINNAGQKRSSWYIAAASLVWDGWKSCWCNCGGSGCGVCGCGKKCWLKNLCCRGEQKQQEVRQLHWYSGFARSWCQYFAEKEQEKQMNCDGEKENWECRKGSLLRGPGGETQFEFYGSAWSSSWAPTPTPTSSFGRGAGINIMSAKGPGGNGKQKVLTLWQLNQRKLLERKLSFLTQEQQKVLWKKGKQIGSYRYFQLAGVFFFICVILGFVILGLLYFWFWWSDNFGQKKANKKGLVDKDKQNKLWWDLDSSYSSKNDMGSASAKDFKEKDGNNVLDPDAQWESEKSGREDKESQDLDQYKDSANDDEDTDSKPNKDNDKDKDKDDSQKKKPDENDPWRDELEFEKKRKEKEIKALKTKTQKLTMNWKLAFTNFATQQLQQVQSVTNSNSDTSTSPNLKGKDTNNTEQTLQWKKQMIQNLQLVNVFQQLLYEKGYHKSVTQSQSNDSNKNLDKILNQIYSEQTTTISHSKDKLALQDLLKVQAVKEINSEVFKAPENVWAIWADKQNAPNYRAYIGTQNIELSFWENKVDQYTKGFSVTSTPFDRRTTKNPKYLKFFGYAGTWTTSGNKSPFQKKFVEPVLGEVVKPFLELVWQVQEQIQLWSQQQQQQQQPHQEQDQDSLNSAASAMAIVQKLTSFTVAGAWADGNGQWQFNQVESQLYFGYQVQGSKKKRILGDELVYGKGWQQQSIQVQDFSKLSAWLWQWQWQTTVGSESSSKNQDPPHSSIIINFSKACIGEQEKSSDLNQLCPDPREVAKQEQVVQTRQLARAEVEKSKNQQNENIRKAISKLINWKGPYAQDKWQLAKHLLAVRSTTSTPRSASETDNKNNDKASTENQQQIQIQSPSTKNSNNNKAIQQTKTNTTNFLTKIKTLISTLKQNLITTINKDFCYEDILRIWADLIKPNYDSRQFWRYWYDKIGERNQNEFYNKLYPGMSKEQQVKWGYRRFPANGDDDKHISWQMRDIYKKNWSWVLVKEYGNLTILPNTLLNCGQLLWYQEELLEHGINQKVVEQIESAASGGRTESAAIMYLYEQKHYIIDSSRPEYRIQGDRQNTDADIQRKRWINDILNLQVFTDGWGKKQLGYNPQNRFYYTSDRNDMEGVDATGLFGREKADPGKPVQYDTKLVANSSDDKRTDPNNHPLYKKYWNVLDTIQKLIEESIKTLLDQTDQVQTQTQSQQSQQLQNQKWQINWNQQLEAQLQQAQTEIYENVKRIVKMEEELGAMMANSANSKSSGGGGGKTEGG